MTLFAAVLAMLCLAAVAAALRLIEATYTRLSRARAAGLDEVAGTGDRLV